MIETTQVLLYSVIVALTILMVIIGWQIYQILSELRKMMIKFNTLVEGTVTTAQSFGKSFQNLAGFSEGITAVLKLFKLIHKKKSNE